MVTGTPQVPEQLVNLGLEDWKRCNEEQRLAKIAMGTIFKMAGQFENVCHVSDAIGKACDSYGDGRLRQADFVKYRKGLQHYFEKAYKQPQIPDMDQRFNFEFTFYNAINPNADGVTLEEFGHLSHHVSMAVGPKIKEYEEAKNAPRQP